MNGRTFVLIFFFWFLISIVTPTLILWTESSKQDLESTGEIEGDEKLADTAADTFRDSERADAPTPAPAPDESELVSRNRKLMLQKITRGAALNQMFKSYLPD